jgi:UDP-glucose 4-epimerase
MRVLLTGASSFTGLWIAKALAAAGAEVTAVCRGRPERYDAARRARIEAVGRRAAVVFDRPFGSDGFRQLVIGALPFDVLCLHHAEVGDFRHPDYQPLEAARSNTLNLAELLAGMRRRGLRRLVYTGTVFEAGEGDGDRPLRAIGAYGLAKTLTAAIVRHAAAEADLEALKVTIPSPFGPGQVSGVLGHLTRCWCAGQPAVLGQPDQVRDFVPVDLLAAHYAAVALGHGPAPGGGRSSPSGHVETVEAFAGRVARELRPRLGLACVIEACRPPQPSLEPRRRFNTEPLAGLFDPAARARLFDQLAQACAGDATPISIRAA